MPVVGTPAELEAAEVAEKDQTNQRIEDVRTVLSTKIGRRFIWRQLCDAKMFHPTFTGNSTSFYRDGWRESQLGLLYDCHLADPSLYLKMHMENADFSKVKRPKV